MSSHSLILSALLAQSRDSVSGKQNGDCAAGRVSIRKKRQ